MKTDAAQRLLDEALKLSADERAALVGDLIDSLDEASDHPAEEVEAAWAKELERRAARVRAGQAGIPAERAVTEARARLHERRG